MNTLTTTFIPSRKNLGASPAQRGGRAFRSNSSVLLSQALRDFRFNPWRASGNAKPAPGIKKVPGTFFDSTL
jgi:hypothetical protein